MSSRQSGSSSQLSELMAFLPHPLQSLRIVSGLLVPREDNPTAEPKSHPRSCFLLTRPPHPARLVSLPLRHTGDFPAHTVPVLTSPFSRPPFSQEAFGMETFSHPPEITSLLSDSVLSLACVSCSSLRLLLSSVASGPS